MELKKQLSSLEPSKRLKELGVKQDSLWWWVNSSYDDGCEGEGRWYCDNKWTLVDHIPATWEFTNDEDVGTMEEKIKALQCISAFTCAELGEMLPIGISISKKVYSKEVDDEEELYWQIHLRNNNCPEGINFTDDSEVNVRAAMLIFLLENKRIKI